MFEKDGIAYRLGLLALLLARPALLGFVCVHMAAP